MSDITTHLDAAEAILNRAEAEGRDLDDAERAEYDTLLERAEKARKVEAVRAAASEPRNREAAFSAPQVITARESSEPRDVALRMIDAGLSGTRDESREMLTRAIDAATQNGNREELDGLTRWTQVAGDEHYARAFNKLWRDPQNGHREFTPRELDAFQNAQALSRAMSLGSGGAGSYLMPSHLDPAIIVTGAGVIDPMRSVCRNEVIATQTWRGVTAAQVAGSWDGEATQVSDDSPTLVQPTVKTHRYQAWIQASYEAAEDTTIGQQVGNLCADSVANALGAALTTGAGDGSNQPTGIITALGGSSSEVAPTTSEAFGRLDPRKVQEAVPARWRGNARFMCNLSIINLMRDFPRLASGTEESLVDDSGPIPRVQGWEIVENSSMDGAYSAAATANNYLLLAGDFRQYLCVTRIGTTIEYVPNVFGANGRPTGERGWFLYTRLGGGVLVADAFRLLDVETTA